MLNEPASPPPDGLVSKLEFARLISRDPSAVSHWIKQSRLTAPALVGEGRHARIDVQLALQQLGLTLSLSHQVGSALRQDGREILGLTAPPAAATKPPTSDPPTESDQARLLRARADREALNAAQAAAEAQARNGTWVIRADADREHGRVLAEALATIERWLPDLAQKLVADPPTDVRATSIMLRAEFRALRATMAREARETAEAEPIDEAA